LPAHYDIVSGKFYNCSAKDNAACNKTQAAPKQMGHQSDVLAAIHPVLSDDFIKHPPNGVVVTTPQDIVQKRRSCNG